MNSRNSDLLNLIINSQTTDFSKGLHTFVNPYSYKLLRDSDCLLSEFSSVSVDGVSLVKLINTVCGTNLVRKSFDMTSLASNVFEDSILRNKSLAFIGSKKNEITKFTDVIKKRYPDINICYFRDGYFTDDLERSEVIGNLVLIKPDYVIVGMGTVIQENFLVDLKRSGWDGVGFTCGGFMHQTANGIVYYPKFFDKYNLRWLYRIYDEPKLFSRYFIRYPIALVKIFLDCIRLKNE